MRTHTIVFTLIMACTTLHTNADIDFLRLAKNFVSFATKEWAILAAHQSAHAITTKLFHDKTFHVHLGTEEAGLFGTNGITLGPVHIHSIFPLGGSGGLENKPISVQNPTKQHHGAHNALIHLSGPLAGAFTHLIMHMIDILKVNPTISEEKLLYATLCDPAFIAYLAEHLIPFMNNDGQQFLTALIPASKKVWNHPMYILPIMLIRAALVTALLMLYVKYMPPHYRSIYKQRFNPQMYIDSYNLKTGHRYLMILLHKAIRFTIGLLQGKLIMAFNIEDWYNINYLLGIYRPAIQRLFKI